MATYRERNLMFLLWQNACSLSYVILKKLICFFSLFLILVCEKKVCRTNTLCGRHGDKGLDHSGDSRMIWLLWHLHKTWSGTVPTGSLWQLKMLQSQTDLAGAVTFLPAGSFCSLRLVCDGAGSFPPWV